MDTNNDDALLKARLHEVARLDRTNIPIVVEPVEPQRGRKFGFCDTLIAGFCREDRWSAVYNQMPRERTIVLQPQEGPFLRTHQPSNALVVGKYDSADPSAAVRYVLKQLSLPVKSLALDISTLPTPLYFLLVRAILDMRVCERLIVAYTEPDTYPEQDLTHGLSHIEPLPGFFGSFEPARQTLLIALLGFEGRRTLAVYRDVAPDLTIAINGFPAFKPGWENRSFRANLDFLTASGAIDKLYLAPAHQPALVLKRLLSLYDEYSSKYNIYVAPLGTKPLGLAACLLAILRDDVKAIYHYPSNPNEHLPQGTGRTWLYHFVVDELLELSNHTR